MQDIMACRVKPSCCVASFELLLLLLLLSAQRAVDAAIGIALAGSCASAVCCNTLRGWLESSTFLDLPVKSKHPHLHT